ncbi:hypothetical protein [Ferrimonas futtsuensis]|uniref:hypothetical protein n=1 Tax=Ferrimonas futtsuensis TaxID=364764 RepID=UPI000405D367|nr:hypothetical protein [Ferrimonas futtsuensis]
MQDDTGQRARYLATLGFSQWTLREEYSEGSKSDSAGSEGVPQHPELTITLPGLCEALDEDIRLALRELDLGECRVQCGDGRNLEVRQGGEVHLALTAEELGSSEGKRRLWSVLRKVA